MTRTTRANRITNSTANVTLPGVGAVLEVRRLTKTYDNGVTAVDNLEFAVERGEVFGLLGPNGAGKSTTMSMLSGTTTPTSGGALVRGVSIAESRTIRRHIGIAFQDSVLDTEFTGRENLRLHARLWGMSKGDTIARIDELLMFMGLSTRADDNVRTYSGGMRRRLELARALLAKPSLVLLDEPTVGLDPAVRDEIWALVSRMRAEENTSIIVSTHYLEEAEAACDRVGIMNHGRLVAIGTPAELIASLGTETVEVSARSSLNQPSIRMRNGVVTAQVPVGGDGHDVLNEVIELLQVNGHEVVRSVRRNTTLADVFASLTNDGFNDATSMTAVDQAEGRVAA
jgi:ABC-2 type transport system ATP-binding protein